MKKISRRLFVEGTGAGIVAATVPLTAQQVEAQQAAQHATGTIPRTSIRLTVNGQARSVAVEDRWTLVELLRDGKAVMLTGQKAVEGARPLTSAIVRQTLLKVGASA